LTLSLRTSENSVLAKFGKYGFAPVLYEGPLPQRALYYHRGTLWRVRGRRDMSLQRLRKYVKGVEQASEQLEKKRRQRGEQSWVTAEFPPVILVLPEMLVSGRVVSGRGYNQQERDGLQEAQRVADETETEGSIANALVRLFQEPTPEEVEAILEEDYQPQTVYLRKVTIMGSAGVTELSGIAVEFDRVLGWSLGELSA
jgi:hypothetical protein